MSNQLSQLGDNIPLVLKLKPHESAFHDSIDKDATYAIHARILESNAKLLAYEAERANEFNKALRVEESNHAFLRSRAMLNRYFESLSPESESNGIYDIGKNGLLPSPRGFYSLRAWRADVQKLLGGKRDPFLLNRFRKRLHSLFLRR